MQKQLLVKLFLISLLLSFSACSTLNPFYHKPETTPAAPAELEEPEEPAEPEEPKQPEQPEKAIKQTPEKVEKKEPKAKVLEKKPVVIVQEPPVQPVKQATKKTTTAPAPAPVEQTIPKVEPVSHTGSLKGSITILGKKNKNFKPSNIVVTLTPLSPQAPLPGNASVHEINMKKKTYNPVVQTVMLGDKLEFHNEDKIKHNVFSSSGDNTFDLGTFKGGSVRDVQLNHSGMVKVYCNIHPEMATFVMVAENPYSYITDESGTFELNNVPGGEYTLSLWHIRGTLEQKVVVNEGTNPSLELVLNTAGYKRVAHKNKFGKNYKKKPALFEDEFY